MNLIQRLFSTKEKTEAPVEEAEIIPQPNNQGDRGAHNIVEDAFRYQNILSMLDRLIHPSVVGNNFIEMFKTIPEVFWPIDYIAKRISEAHFDLKRVKDDSLVWCNRLGADTILKQPNPIMTWREIVYQHFVYKLATGNAFFRASMPETVTADAIKFQWCSNYWSLPAHLVEVKPMEYSYGVPIFGIANIDELIKGYTLNLDAYSGLTIPYWQIWHDRDGIPEMIRGNGYLKAESRLLSVKKPIANLIAVYEARNVIFLKRGALGFIVAQKEDPTGTVALEPSEKEELHKEFNSKYGLEEGKSPFAITDIPVNFIKTSSSIAEMQPFDETLEDAIKIASVFGIPADLVPRKDQSTYANRDSAEKGVYTSTIIPAAKRFCEAITQFLGLEAKGLYLDCDFNDVACLQVGLKESEEVKKLVNERCLSQFNNGLISINDWRSQIHEDALDGDIFDKTKFEMTPDEIAKVDNVIKAQTSPIQINTGQPGDKNIDNNQPNNKPSKEKVMKEQMINLQYETKALDVSEKGIVTVGVNGIGIEDAQHDISMPGSFVDTLRDDMHKMRWYLNHDTRQLLGVPLSGEEKDNNLIMTGQLNLKKQIGRDILEDYKLFRDCGRTLEHSIGVKALARDEEDRRKVVRWKMLEYSTLTGWGANPQTFLVGLKSATEDQLRDAVELIRMAFKQRGYSDERLKNYDMELNLLLKSLGGGLIVTCPCCGHQFDYDNEPEHTFSQEVQDAASEFVSSIARNEACRRIEHYRPEIQAAVSSIIDGMAATKKEITTKSIVDAFAYVRCPHCWSRVYRSNNILVADPSTPNEVKEKKPEDEEGKKDDDTKKKSADVPTPSPSSSFWASLNAATKK